MAGVCSTISPISTLPRSSRLAFLTGDTISPDAQVFLRATKRPYLEKPIKPDELRSFVSKLVNKDIEPARL